ncbi:MAG: uroporphyrinogen-III decarboxylase-like protein [Planctomycetes bacterium]|nr:uroporphyrinogen-III decarboxylase-like protein [Planctomycetota bacterium]
MPKETMSPKERWLAVLNRQKPDRVPMDFRGTGEVQAKLLKHFDTTDMQDVFSRLHIDNPVGAGGDYIGPQPPPDTDIWGRTYRDIAYEGGSYRECVSHPLAGFETVEEIEASYVWPTADLYDYSSVSGKLKGKDDYPVMAGGSEPFLLYRDLRGHEQAYMDLVLHPDIVHYCLDKLFDFCYENTRRIYEAVPGRVTMSYVAEDLGSQEDLLMSLDHIREFLLPRMKRMVDLVHSAGAFSFWHSDGSIRKILPDMLDIGQDVLDPIQWRCRNMDRAELKRDFGDRIILHGGVDNQKTLAFDTPKDVEEEVIYNLKVLGEGGGYVLSPCHNIQAVSPVENIIAMYETGYAHGWT